MVASLPRIGALFASLLILAAGSARLLQSQGISEDEIRWGSRPYVPQSASAIRVQTTVVQVPVVVRDSHGKAVAGLKKSDFQLFDDGHPVEIASFSVENFLTAPPAAPKAPQVADASLPPVPAMAPMNPPAPPARYIALFFDDTSMRMFDVAMARKAAESFVKTNLRPGDRIGIFTTSTTVSLNFTDNVPELLKALEQLLTHRAGSPGAGSACYAMNPYQAWEITHMYDTHSDALDLALNEGCGSVHDIISAAQNMLGQAEQHAQDILGVISDVIRYLGRMPSQRMLVLASSGFLTQTVQEKQDKVINEALNANVIINSLDAKGLVAETPGYDEDMQPMRLSGKWQAVYDQFKTANREYQNDPLAILAEGTGGHFYHNRNDLDVGLKEMATAPDVSYLLTFSPGVLKRNGAPHTLKVKLADSHGMNITARRGYVAPGPTLTETEKRMHNLEAAVLSTDIQSALIARVITDVGKSGTGEPVLKVALHMNANKLPYQTQGDRKVERLIFITALFDDHDRFLTGVQGIMDLRLKPETLASLLDKGLNAKLSVQIDPGNYRLRQVIQEVGDGQITTFNRNVTIQ
jgi:VWFA-related protein